VWAKWTNDVDEEEKRFVRRDMWRHLPLRNTAEHQIVLASDKNGYFLTLVSATSPDLAGVREHAEAFASVNLDTGQEFGTYFFVGSKSGELARVDGLDAKTDDEGTKEKFLPEYRSMAHFFSDQRPRFLPLGPAALYRGIWVEHKNGTERTLREKEEYFKKNAVKIAKSGLDKFLRRGLFEAGENWQSQDPFLNEFISTSQKAHLAVFFNEPDESINLRLLSFHTRKNVARVVCAVRGCPFLFVDDEGVVWFLKQEDEECEVAFRTVNGGCTAWSVRQFLFWITSTAEEKHKLVWNRFVFEFVGLTLRGQSMLDHQSLDTLVVLVKGDQMAVKYLDLTVNPTTWREEFEELRRHLPSNSAITRQDLLDVFKMPLRNTDGKPPSMRHEGEDAGFVPAPDASARVRRRPAMRRLQRISAEDLQSIAAHAVRTYKAEVRARGAEAKDAEGKDAEAKDAEAKDEGEDAQMNVNTRTLLGLGSNGAVYAVNDSALKLSLVNNDHEHLHQRESWENELKVAKLAAGDGQSGPGPDYLSGGIVKIGTDNVGFVLMERMQMSLRKAVETIHYPLQWAIELIKALNKAAKTRLVCTDLHLGNWMVNLRNGNIVKMRMIDFGECKECILGEGYEDANDAYSIKNIDFKEGEITPVIELYSLVHFLSSCQIVLWNDMWSPGVLVALKRVNALITIIRDLQIKKMKPTDKQGGRDRSTIGQSETYLIDKVIRALKTGRHNPLVYWALSIENAGVRKTPPAAVDKVPTAVFGTMTEFNTLDEFITAVFDKNTVKRLEKKNK